MKNYFLLVTAIAVLISCSKHEVVDDNNLNGTATKTYSMTVDLMAGQHINVGTVSFYDPTDGNGGPLEVTFNLTGGWTMTESHVYAGPEEDIPTNRPGAPKVGKFPFQETHLNVTEYTYYIPVNSTENFAIAAHCVVNNNGSETGWASGDKTFNDKGWGTYISNFYSISNFTANILYGITENNDGSLNLVLIDANSGTGDLIVTEYVVGSGAATAAAYDPQTSTFFFVIDDVLYGNDMNCDSPSYLIKNLSTSSIYGATFMNGNYYYYSGASNQIIEVQMNYTSGTGWLSSNDEIPYTGVMPHSSYFTVTDITSNDNYFYLIGYNTNSGTTSIDLLDYNISTSIYNPDFVETGISNLVDSPVIAWSSISNELYGVDVGTNGEEYLITIDIDTGETNGDPETPIGGGGEDPEDPENPIDPIDIGGIGGR
jgi:hypothetical protein